MKIEDKIILALSNESNTKYYWIGQIISKGSINANSKFVLNIKPSNSFEDFFKINIEEASLYSKKLCKYLYNYGLEPNKSNMILNNIPEQYSISFIKGYIDAKGSFRNKRSKDDNLEYVVSTSGPESIMNFISNYFKNINVKDTDFKTKSINISGNNKVFDFLDKIYNESTIHDDKNYNFYLELKKLILSKHKEINNDDIIKEYNTNKVSVKSLSEKHSVSISSINKILNQQQSSRRYNFTQDYFENINTENKAYFLGLLFADGGLNKNYTTTLSLSIKDLDIIKKFSNEIKTNHSIHDRTKEGKGIFANVKLHSKQLYEDLFKLGCTQAKSFTTKFPKINDELIHHFIRGYYDGDGGINLGIKSSNYSVVGSVEFINEMKNILKQNNIWTYSEESKHKKGDLIRISNCGKRSTYNFCKYLYKDSNMWLDRKKFYFDLLKKIISRQNYLAKIGTRGYPKQNIIEELEFSTELIELENIFKNKDYDNFYKIITTFVFDSNQTKIEQNIKLYKEIIKEYNIDSVLDLNSDFGEMQLLVDNYYCLSNNYRGQVLIQEFLKQENVIDKNYAKYLNIKRLNGKFDLISIKENNKNIDEIIKNHSHDRTIILINNEIHK